MIYRLLGLALIALSTLGTAALCVGVFRLFFGH